MASKTLRQRSGDLFGTDQPIPASQMIGRETDVREISSTLAGGLSVVLAGARRTGKTSVCDAVLGRLARRGLRTVSVDLFRIATTAELAEALVAATISNRSALRRALHQTRLAGRFVSGALQTSAVLKSKAQLGEELRSPSAPVSRHATPIAISTTRSRYPHGWPQPTVRRSSYFSMSFRRSPIHSSPMAILTASRSACGQSSSARPASATCSRAASSI